MSIKSDKEYTRKLQAMSTEQLHKESNRLYASDHSTQKDIQSVAREQLVRMVLNYAPADAVAALFEPERRSCEDPDATYLCGFELAGGRIVTSKSNVQWCDYIQEAGQEIWNNDISSVSYGGARMPYVWEDDSPDGTLSLLIRPRKQTKPIQLETLTKKRLKEMTDAQLKKAWKQAESVYLLGDGQTLDQMNPYAEQALSILESTAAEMMRRKGFAPTGLTRSQMAKISTQDLEKFVNKHDQTVNALLKSLDPQIESPRWMFEIDVLDQQVNAALFQRHTLETRNEFEKIFHQIGLPQSKSKRLDANGLPLMVSGWEDLFVAADLDSLKKMASC